MTISQNNEQWMPITGYEHYEISTHGNVRSITRKNKQFLNGKEYFITLKGQLIAKKPHHKGYDKTSLTCINKKRKNFFIHRIVAEHFIPNPENKEQVNHIDKNKKNNNISNLEWMTQSENLLHSSEELSKAQIKRREREANETSQES